MAWKWPGATKGASNEEWTGFIDQGVTLEGTLTVTGTFRIDGNVKGNIISEQAKFTLLAWSSTRAGFSMAAATCWRRLTRFQA